VLCLGPLEAAASAMVHKDNVLPFFNVELPLPVYDFYVAIATVALFLPVVVVIHHIGLLVTLPFRAAPSQPKEANKKAD